MIITEHEAKAIEVQNERLAVIKQAKLKVTPKQKRQHKIMTKVGHFKPDDRLDNLTSMIDSIAGALANALMLPGKDVAKIITYWCRRAPLDEREDLVQELAEKLLKENPPTLKLAFITLKRDTIDYLRRYYTMSRSNLSLDTPTGDGDCTLGDMVADTIEFEEMVNLKRDTIALLDLMDSKTRRAIGRKLAGERLTNLEKQMIREFAVQNREFVYA